MAGPADRRAGAARRPRIALLTDSREPSGVGEHMLALAGGLQPAFEVLVACPETGPGMRLLERARCRGVAISTFAEGDDAGAIARCAAWGADLLHIHAGIGWEGHGLAGAGRSLGIPIVRTEHLPYVITDAGQRRQHAEGVALVDRVIAVSGAVAGSLIEAGLPPASIATIRNGIDPLRPTRDRAAVRAGLGLAPADIMLLTVARFTAQKGHDVLAAAMATIAGAAPAARLFLVGTGPCMEMVAASIGEHGLAGRVGLLGQRDDVPDLLAAADLFVLPSRFEGLPLALLEAMAAGLPVVATRIGGVVEVVGEGYPHLVPPDDAVALAAAILALAADPAARRTQGGALAARFRQAFEAGRMAAETGRLYAALGVTPDRNRERSTPMTKTRIGFIGAGGIAQRHLGVLEQFADVALVAFADPDLARAEAAAARFGAHAYADHAPMLEEEALDAVYICVPPFAHGEPERDVLAHDLPFFVEKPLSVAFGVAEDIAAEVARRGLVTAVGYHWRYLDTVEEAQALLAGNPAHLVSGYWLDATPPPAWWGRLDRSGGQMVEQTTHILDLARHLVGEVTEVFGLAAHRARDDFPDLDVPTASTASLRFASGAIGNVGSTCLLRWGHRVGLHLFADGLAIELTDHDIMVDVGRGRPVRAAGDDPVRREDRDFVDAVRGGENRIRCPYGEALETHRLALAITRSARTGRPVAVTPVPEAVHG